MKLPWVSRYLYEGTRFLLDAEREQHQADRQAWVEERQGLVNTITHMQRAGFKLVDPVQPQPPQPSLPSAISAAITDHMELSGSAGRQTAQWAEARLREGWTVDRITSLIHQGVEHEDAA